MGGGEHPEFVDDCSSADVAVVDVPEAGHVGEFSGGGGGSVYDFPARGVGRGGIWGGNSLCVNAMD